MELWLKLILINKEEKNKLISVILLCYFTAANLILIIRRIEVFFFNYNLNIN